tara:strand:+ start:231 stop:449 length:219 start_codon:yes stop_codon:yes gene_type:complete
MGRRLREDRIKNEVLTHEDLCKKEIVDMQKTLQWCYIRIKELNDEIELMDDEIHDLKSQLNDVDNRQTEMEF